MSISLQFLWNACLLYANFATISIEFLFLFKIFLEDIFMVDICVHHGREVVGNGLYQFTKANKFPKRLRQEIGNLLHPEKSIDLNFVSNQMKYDHADTFPLVLEPIRLPFVSITNGNLSRHCQICIF